TLRRQAGRQEPAGHEPGPAGTGPGQRRLRRTHLRGTGLSQMAVGSGRRDLAQPIMAGALAAIVGYASTFTLVLAALAQAGASPQQAGSGLMAVCLAMALLNIVVAFQVKTPVSFAWTTPGAAFLLTVGEPVGGFPAVAGAFLVTGALIVLTG